MNISLGSFNLATSFLAARTRSNRMAGVFMRSWLYVRAKPCFAKGDYHLSNGDYHPVLRSISRAAFSRIASRNQSANFSLRAEASLRYRSQSASSMKAAARCAPFLRWLGTAARISLLGVLTSQRAIEAFESPENLAPTGTTICKWLRLNGGQVPLLRTDCWPELGMDYRLKTPMKPRKSQCLRGFYEGAAFRRPISPNPSQSVPQGQKRSKRGTKLAPNP